MLKRLSKLTLQRRVKNMHKTRLAINLHARCGINFSILKATHDPKEDGLPWKAWVARYRRIEREFR